MFKPSIYPIGKMPRLSGLFDRSLSNGSFSQEAHTEGERRALLCTELELCCMLVKHKHQNVF